MRRLGRPRHFAGMFVRPFVEARAATVHIAAQSLGNRHDILHRPVPEGMVRRAPCAVPEGVAGTRAGGGSGHAVSGSGIRSEEHTSELQSLMRISYAVFCLKKKKQT